MKTEKPSEEVKNGGRPPKIDDGGSAFPHIEPGDTWRGMSLRDYFAGQALIGLMQRSPTFHSSPSVNAKIAYDMADAMIESRKKVFE